MTDAWYAQVEAAEGLTQGDMINACPVLEWDTSFAGLEPAELEQGCGVSILDTIVITQACDLADDASIVTLCPCYSLSDHRRMWEEQRRALRKKADKNAWSSHCKQVTSGFIWNLAMLNRNEEEEQRIVRFEELFTVPHQWLREFLAARNEPRRRLLPPYREHLSQAFARYYMRVGLPTAIERSW